MQTRLPPGVGVLCPTPGSWCPWCRSTAGKVVPIIQVDHPGPRLATAAVVPVVPIIDGGKLVPTCRVVPAVPIIDLAAVLPYAGKLVPVVPCPSSRATPWQAGADHRPCQRRSLRHAHIDAGALQREGRARQYESIILRNWPECGHRRRLNCSTFTAGGGAGAWVLPPSVSPADCHGPADDGIATPCAVTHGPAAVVGRSIIRGHGSQRPRWCPWCRSSTAGSWCRRAESCRPCRSSTLPRSCPTPGSWCPWCHAHHPGPRPGKLVPIIDLARGGHVFVDRPQSMPGQLSRSREGRARQYESIILRNWPECGHRRRLNCSTFTAGGGAGAWVLPSSVSLLTPRAGKGIATPCADSPAAAVVGRSLARATARNGRGGARGADHRRREAGADVPSRAGRADHRPCRGPALRREAGARGAMPIIQGHALASWCRSSTLPEAVPSSCPSSTAGRSCPSV